MMEHVTDSFSKFLFRVIIDKLPVALGIYDCNFFIARVTARQHASYPGICMLAACRYKRGPMLAFMILAGTPEKVLRRCSCFSACVGVYIFNKHGLRVEPLSCACLDLLRAVSDPKLIPLSFLLTT